MRMGVCGNDNMPDLCPVFATVPLVDLAVCVKAGSLSVVWFECYKYWSTKNS